MALTFETFFFFSNSVREGLTAFEDNSEYRGVYALPKYIIYHVYYMIYDTSNVHCNSLYRGTFEI